MLLPEGGREFARACEFKLLPNCKGLVTDTATILMQEECACAIGTAMGVPLLGCAPTSHTFDAYSTAVEPFSCSFSRPMTHAAGPALLIAILLLLSGDAAVAVPPSTLFANPNGQAPQLELQQAAETCAEFKELYANIDADLARWKEDGIPLELMQQTIAEHTTRKGGQKGIAVAFLNGKAYLLDEPNLTVVGHHANLLFMYMRLMVHLEQTFRMPDVVRFLGRQDAAACELLGCAKR